MGSSGARGKINHHTIVMLIFFMTLLYGTISPVDGSLDYTQIAWFRYAQLEFSEHPTTIRTGETIDFDIRSIAILACPPDQMVNTRNELPLYKFRLKIDASCAPDCLNDPPTVIVGTPEVSSMESRDDVAKRIYVTDDLGRRHFRFVTAQPGTYRITTEGMYALIQKTHLTEPYCPSFCPGTGTCPQGYNTIQAIARTRNSTTEITVLPALQPPGGSGSWSNNPTEHFTVQMYINPGTIWRDRNASLQVLVWHNGAPDRGRRVELISDGGTIDQPIGTTDANGWYTTTFSAPLENRYTVIAKSAILGEDHEATSMGYVTVVKEPDVFLPDQSNAGLSVSPFDLLPDKQAIEDSRTLEQPSMTFTTDKPLIAPYEITTLKLAIIDSTRPEHNVDVSFFINGQFDHTETLLTTQGNDVIEAYSILFSSKEEGIFNFIAQVKDWDRPNPPPPVQVTVTVTSSAPGAQETLLSRTKVESAPMGILDMIFSIPSQILAVFTGTPPPPRTVTETDGSNIASGENDITPSPGDGAACNDGSFCTYNDHMENGVCTGTHIDCDDHNPETGDSCESRVGCIHIPSGPLIPVNAKEGDPCNDMNPCTVSDTIRNRVCIGDLIQCSDGDDLTADACDPETGQCIFMPAGKYVKHAVDIVIHPDLFPPQDGTSCDDGNKCTVSDTLINGVCVGTAIYCDDGYELTEDSCDPNTGQCVFTQIAKNLERPTTTAIITLDIIHESQPRDGMICNDNNLCTVDDRMAGGQCAGTPIVCDDGDGSTLDTCDQSTGQCIFIPVRDLIGRTRERVV